MKRTALTLAMACFLGAGLVSPAYACEGGKCTKEHTQQDGKNRKDKKASTKAESCHMTAAKETKSCCAKKDAAKTSQPAKEEKAQ
ncbi:hypothetical protein [Pontibacter litorisediminis]|uniref:hypothetical protein n=1 Tax=Pontibacter litorisediminis TaxID=1846260 RepID=UPI0023ED8FAC|nr:hypothetical protein [Pontibacter litorisediminis]